MAKPPTVYTIPAGLPFLDMLAGGLMERHGGSPLGLARVTVLLPTRRAARGLGDAFLRLSGGAPRLLPLARAIGDVDEAELALAGGTAAADAALPPAISTLKRQLLLTRLILANPKGPDNRIQAVGLAADLGELLDQVQTEGLSFDGLKDLVPAALAEHWQKTVEFLAIVTDAWPRILTGEGEMDPALRRNALLEAQARQLEDNPPANPVIAAGSTGSIPATARLLGVVARLTEGALVLPGLDLDMDEACWRALEETHPQFGMKQLLERIRVDRGEVTAWPFGAVAEAASGANAARRLVLAEALRPASATAVWRRLDLPQEAGLEGLELVEAADVTQEAGAIALMMRGALETPGETAALVTPDRGLARRVAVELARWDLAVDDSAGRPLAETPPAVLLRLSAELVASGAAPVPLLAALKHPLAAGGRAPAEFRAQARRVEIAVLRGPRPPAGLDGLRAAYAAHAKKHKKNKAAHKKTLAWLDGLAAAAAPLAGLMTADQASLGALLAAHGHFAEWLAATGQATGAERLWAGEAGEGLALFLQELVQAGADLMLAPREYPALLEVLMVGRRVRPRYGRHPRLYIWGPLEARLQQADLVILGGLNEGTWPADADTGPWLNRPMRKALGLPAPERRVGLAAHDFSQAAAAPRVVLTRSAKSGGSPTVPSRWLLRLETLLGGNAMAQIKGGPWRDWQSLLDAPGLVTPVGPPRPRPPLAARPRRVSVTGVETWMRDPYSIFAKEILRLKPLDSLDADPGAAERGTFIHHILERFVGEYEDSSEADELARLAALGEQVFAEQFAHLPTVRAFWWPRFRVLAAWFVAHERNWRRLALPLKLEHKGTITFDAPGGEFTLSATADRIDGLRKGGLAIIDYKTGAPPKAKIVRAGFAPQLPLEAAMARRGAFPEVTAAEVGYLAFWRLGGSGEGGEVAAIKPEDIDELAEAAWAGLAALVAEFDKVTTAYRARPRPEHAGWGDYDHLARVKEWPDS